MTDLKDGGPAFPVNAGSQFSQYSGMSLRDWFAGQAVQGILAGTWADDVKDAKQLGTLAYDVADALLKSREGTE